MRNGNAAGPETPLDEITRVMNRVHGLDISGYEASFLARTLERRLTASGCGTPAIYLAERLFSDRSEARALHDALRVGYSAFFRDPLTFALLEQRVLPDIIESAKKIGRKGLRIWSAGCAAGQEAWSIAMLLDEPAVSGNRRPAYRILATDIFEPDLALARAGVYSGAEVGYVRLRHLAACFDRQGDRYAEDAPVRERVEFAAYDLLDTATTCPPTSIFGDFDLVLCCNVMIYYDNRLRRRIRDKLLGSLAPGGYLVTGETERSVAASVRGVVEVVSSAPIFQKG